MSNFVSMKVDGLSDLHNALKSLSGPIAVNIMRAALRHGAVVISDEAKARVPVDSGQLRESIRVSSRLVAGMAVATVKIGSRFKVYKGGKVAKGKPYKTVSSSGKVRYHAAYYARFVEFGTVHMAARPFMRPAFESKKTNAVEVIAEYIRKRIDKEAARLNRGGK